MTILFWILFIVLLIGGVPVAFSIGLSSISLLLSESTNNAIVIGQKLVNGLDSFTLLAIPFFMCSCAIMGETKIADRIFDFANALVGHIRGGLAQVNIVDSVIQAGMSGTAVNDIAGMGRLEILAMERKGYDRKFAAAVTAASSSIGPIIPPSIPLVLIGSIMGVSISKMLIGGIVPGLLMAGAMMIVVAIISTKRKYPKLEKTSLKTKLVSFVKAIPALLMPLILIGGFLEGFMTPTESACVAVIYAFLLGFVFYREVKIKDIIRIFKKSALLCSSTMLIISCSAAFGLVITEQQIPQRLAAFFMSLSNNPQIILLLMCILFLIIGCFLETTSVFIIMTPILMVVAQQYGIDLVHFGVLEALIVTVGLYTPPVGVGMFLTCKVAHISTKSFLKEIWPFLIALFVVCVLVIFIPGLVTWLPNLLFD